MSTNPNLLGGRRPYRDEGVDFLRGAAMVVMALDHVRQFLHDAPFDPLDLSSTHAALFLTRWVTHFCAPVFVLLAGAGAFLSTTRGKTRPQVAWLLLTRGLWLVVLEFTLVHFGWFFNLSYDVVLGQVIWAIGFSMVALAGLVYLPTWAITAIGLTLIAGHNLFDAVAVEDLGPFGWLWVILMSGGSVDGPAAPWPQVSILVLYPLLPWSGIMAAGFGLGRLWLLERGQRRRYLLGLGVSLLLLFVALRAVNVYGDPYPWERQRASLFTLFSFINCWKYPPSLCFVLMTLGPAFTCRGSH